MMHYFDPTVTWSIALDTAVALVVIETAALEDASGLLQSAGVTWIQYASAGRSGHCLVMTFLDNTPTGEEGQRFQACLDSMEAEGVPIWLYRRSATRNSPLRLVAGKSLI